MIANFRNITNQFFALSTFLLLIHRLISLGFNNDFTIYGEEVQFDNKVAFVCEISEIKM